MATPLEAAVESEEDDSSIQHVDQPNENLTRTIDIGTPLDAASQSGGNDGSNIQHGEDPNVNLPPEDEESEEYQQKIETLHQRGEPINILVIGSTGAGKSALINNLMGGNVAQVSHSTTSEQSEVEAHEGEHKGIRIKIYDTVGFGDREGQVNSTILNAQGNFDLVILCIDIGRRADHCLQTILSNLKSNLHIELWNHLVVVLTHTNQFIEQPSLKNMSVTEKKAVLKIRITEFKSCIYSWISSHVDRDTYDKIPFCTAGTGDIEPLFQENWLNPLWVSCIGQCSEEAQPFLMGYAEYILGKRLFRSYYARFRRNEENLRDQENPGG